LWENSLLLNQKMLKLFLQSLLSPANATSMLDTTEDDVKAMCAEFGKVSLVSLPKDRTTEQPRGFAFVDMASNEELEAAINGLDGRVVSGREIRANKSLPKGSKPAPQKDGGKLHAGAKKLYVGNLPFEISREELSELFQDYGELYEIYMPMKPNSSEGRGFAFVTIKSEEAERAIEDKNGIDYYGRRLVVSEPLAPGEKRERKPRESRSQNVKMYVGNLSFYTLPETLVEVFGEFGEVYDCYLPEDRVTGGSRGFGFVTMAKEDAERAMEELNGCEVDGRTISVTEAQVKKQRDWSDEGSSDFEE
jgi:RNA recognition motif-containing protein